VSEVELIAGDLPEILEGGGERGGFQLVVDFHETEVRKKFRN